jgi:probable rRNA maturation factor
MIEIDNRQAKVEITENIRDIIINAISFSLKYENFTLPYEVCVVLTDNENIKDINYKHRKINKETDILSFPLVDFNSSVYDPSDDLQKRSLLDAINPETDEVMLGDIILSIEQATLQAKEYDHNLLREVGFLIVHSVLHLLGYDHIREEDRVIMRNRENSILSMMKLER